MLHRQDILKLADVWITMVRRGLGLVHFLEWGMTVQVDEFMDGVRARTELLETFTTPPEVVDWVHRQHQKVPTPESVLEWEDVQELAGEILVRGTLRHRENDHFVEYLGKDWHVAVTHDMAVYTADDFGRVFLD